MLRQASRQREAREGKCGGGGWVAGKERYTGQESKDGRDEIVVQFDVSFQHSVIRGESV